MTTLWICIKLNQPLARLVLWWRHRGRPRCNVCGKLAARAEACSGGTEYYGCKDHVGQIEAGKWAWSYSIPVNMDLPEVWEESQNASRNLEGWHVELGIGDLIMTKEFEKVNGIFGWGDPGSSESPGIWFVGIEEADEYGKEGATIPEKVNLAKKEIKKLPQNQKFIECTALTNESDKRERQNPMYRYVSKIVCTLNPLYRQTDWREIWRRYRDETLWHNGSRVCNANLFPLGKPRTTDWPSQYCEVFGFSNSEEDKDKYLNIVRDRRYREMRKFWEHCRPQATICYGRTYKDDFEKMLLGYTVEEKEWVCLNKNETGDILCHQERRIILAPHFSRHMSNAKVDVILNQLKNNWRINLW